MKIFSRFISVAVTANLQTLKLFSTAPTRGRYQRTPVALPVNRWRCERTDVQLNYLQFVPCS